MQAFRRIRKRAAEPIPDEPVAKKKKCDCERAHKCVQCDCLGADAPFEKQFDRIFRVTRGIVERLIQVCGNNDFFTHRQLRNGDFGMCPEVKALVALKTLGFGCSSAAFIDHFQMSLTSGRDCVRQFCRTVANSKLCDINLRDMSRQDAKRVSNPHENQFGVPGLLGVLDCVHVHWRTCPVAWQGQHKGKEDQASIALEAITDCTTWVWHLKFGCPGTLNDMNIWDQSKMLRIFLDGSFAAAVDFLFSIGNETFDNLHFLVDGNLS